MSKRGTMFKKVVFEEKRCGMSTPNKKGVTGYGRLDGNNWSHLEWDNENAKPFRW